MYIPLLETLQSLLNNMSVRREVSFIHVIYMVSLCTHMHIYKQVMSIICLCMLLYNYVGLQLSSSVAINWIAWWLLWW